MHHYPNFEMQKNLSIVYATLCYLFIIMFLLLYPQLHY